MICAWEYTSFETLCSRQDKRLYDFENVIKDFLNEAKNNKVPTRFILHWKNKFSNAINFHFDYDDDYIRTKRKLDKVEGVIREFIDEVNNQDENFKMPKHENENVRMRMFVDSMKELQFMNHWRDRVYTSMNLPF